MSDTQPATMIRPLDIVFRCYVRRSGRVPSRWVAHCVDLDLWATGDSPAAAKKSIENAISSYLEVVLDTDDRGSIPRLLQRRAPLRYMALWHFIRLLVHLRHNGRWPLRPELFEEHLPFPLRLSKA